MQFTRINRVDEILCIGAHGDDIEIGCGGTLLQLLADHPGAKVHWIVFSANQERRQETLAAADLFLAEATSPNVEVLQFRDSYFPQQSGEIKEYFHSLASKVSPDLIFTHRRNDAHQDHRVLADLSWCAFRDHLILEYEIPKYEGDLGQPNVFVELSEKTATNKANYIWEKFHSQQDKPWFRKNTLLSLATLRGVECRAREGYAEGFYCRKLVVSG